MQFLRFMLAVALLGAVVAWPRFTAAAEQKVALVIGNSAYPSSRLRNPVNDAKAMADKLRTLGFDVILKTDAGQREMTRSFSQFGQKLALGSVGLFYYAGHGVQVQGKNFLIPVDAEIESEASVRTEAVDVDQLLHQLGSARLSMVILDACRNNPFERRFRGAGGGLAQIDAPTGTMLAYATAPGKVASDGAGSNGLYTEALLKALNMPGLKVEDVFKQVRINVVKASDGQQTPWESSSLTGEFYFVPDNKPALADEKLKQAEKERAELTKALEESQKQHNKDAELVRAEMEKLRAELQRIRSEAAASIAPVVSTAGANTSPTKPPSGTPTENPGSARIAVAPSNPPQLPVPPPSTSAKSPIVPSPPASAPPQQIATLAQPPASAPAATGEWAQRTALLEKLRGKLTFAKAIALIFDITSTNDLIQLAQFENFIRNAGWANAMAIGSDRQGNATWAGAARFRNSAFANETALSSCVRETNASCVVVLINGNFQEKQFLEWAHQLTTVDPGLLRASLLKSISAEPKQTASAGGWGANANILGNASQAAVVYFP